MKQRKHFLLDKLGYNSKIIIDSDVGTEGKIKYEKDKYYDEIKYKPKEREKLDKFLIKVAYNTKHPWKFSILSENYGPNSKNVYEYYKVLIRKPIDKNVLMIILDSNYLELVMHTLEILSKLESSYQPKLFFIIKNAEKPQDLIDQLRICIEKDYIYFYDMQDIFFFPYEDNISSVFVELMNSSCYFNELGDYTTDFKGLIRNDANTENNNKIMTKLTEELPKNNLTFNILTCGYPGVGKSTLENAFLGKKKCKTGVGRSITKK